MNTKHVIVAVVLLCTGSMNTLLIKWTDLSSACGEYDCSRGKRLFQHPFVQAMMMFFGEFLCFIAFFVLRGVKYLRLKRRGMGEGDDVALLGSEGGGLEPLLAPKYWLLFLPPALCDMVASSTIYIGLNLTFASSFQMLRGSVILFTGLLSVAFLAQTIARHQWVGMSVVTLGLVCVGAADIIFNGGGGASQSDPNAIIAGDLLIILAQIIAASQFVIEQRYLRRYNVPPLLAVGLEGMFGVVILGLLLIPMSYIPAGRPFSSDPGGHLENPRDAFIMMSQNWHILLGIIGSVLSIAVFNFSGITITKEVSATTRMVLDSGRTLIIWVFSLAVAWQPFAYKSFLLQLAGFLLLVSGMCVYNDLLFAPLLRRCGLLSAASNDNRREDDFDTRPLGGVDEYSEGETGVSYRPERLVNCNE